MKQHLRKIIPKPHQPMQEGLFRNMLALGPARGALVSLLPKHGVLHTAATRGMGGLAAAVVDKGRRAIIGDKSSSQEGGLLKRPSWNRALGIAGAKQTINKATGRNFLRRKTGLDIGTGKWSYSRPFRQFKNSIGWTGGTRKQDGSLKLIPKALHALHLPYGHEFLTRARALINRGKAFRGDADRINQTQPQPKQAKLQAPKETLQRRSGAPKFRPGKGPAKQQLPPTQGV